MKNIVITGTSSGIGRATAERLVKNGYRVFGSVRREKDGEALRKTLGDQFIPLVLDVTDSKTIDLAVSLVSSVVKNGCLAGLINNAGIVVQGPIMHMPVEAVREMFDINVLGVLRMTQAFLPLLGAVKNRRHAPGRIINISSMSGKCVHPFMAAYASSKFALEALSDGLRRELLPYGIEVSVIEPGDVDTPIYEKQSLRSPYAHTDYGLVHQKFLDAVPAARKNSLPVGSVVDAIIAALTDKKPAVRTMVPGESLKQKIEHLLLPARHVDRRIAQGTFGGML